DTIEGIPEWIVPGYSNSRSVNLGGHGGEVGNPVPAEVVRYSVYANCIYCFYSFPPQRSMEETS
ncbi:unnamed protein product, partial [marine sediment metagenome]